MRRRSTVSKPAKGRVHASGQKPRKARTRRASTADLRQKLDRAVRERNEAPVLGHKFATDIIAAEFSCTSCGCDIAVVTFLRVAVESKIKDFEDIYIPIGAFRGMMSAIDLLMSAIPTSFRQKHGIGNFVANELRHYTRLSNSCIHCGAHITLPWGLENLPHPIFQCELPLSSLLSNQVDIVACDRFGWQHDVFRWWFDGSSTLDPSFLNPVVYSDILNRDLVDFSDRQLTISE